MSEPAAFGRFEGRTHILPLRIYYEDTDLSGVVYHANYLRFMERGRSEYFRAAGIARLADLEGAEPWAWTLRKVELEFLRPARVDDLIAVHTQCIRLSGVRMAALQTIHANGALLTRGQVEACIITLTGKPKRIPRDAYEILAPLVVETEA